MRKNHLQEIRKAKGLSQSKLALLTDISILTIQTWEQGTRTLVDVYMLKKLADALDVKIDDLVDL